MDPAWLRQLLRYRRVSENQTGYASGRGVRSLPCDPCGAECIAELFREQTIGADLYLAGINPGDNSVHRAKPCPICSRLIIQAGIKNVYLRVGAKAGEYEVVPAKDLVWHL